MTLSMFLTEPSWFREVLSGRLERKTVTLQSHGTEKQDRPLGTLQRVVLTPGSEKANSVQVS